MDDSTDVVALCARIMQFYAHESCGQCTPCREGTGWLARVCTRVAQGRGRAGRRRPAGQRSPTASPATRSARSATPRPGRCWASSPSSAPTSRPSSAQPKAPALERRRPEQSREAPHRSLLAPAAASVAGDAGRSSGSCSAALGRRLRAASPSRGATRSTAVMSLVATFFGLAAIYAIAVRALPGGPAGAGLRRRHHGAVHLRRHDPEPRGGRAAGAARPGAPAVGVAGGRLPAGQVRATSCSAIGAADAARRRSSPRRSAPSSRRRPAVHASSCYPFEAISLLLLVAIVGGVVVSRSHQKEVAATRAADCRKRSSSWPPRLPGDAA